MLCGRERQGLAVPSLNIVLVGQEDLEHENLGMRYVAAALRDAGHRVTVEPSVGVSAVESLARRLIEQQAPLIGLAISDTFSVVELLVLARCLRDFGYQGHITAGGPLATLSCHELLRTQPALDSVIRHAGEGPMVELAACLSLGQPFAHIAGLTTRAGDGSLARVDAPLAHRPLRRENLPSFMGVRAAEVLASRGCNGNCAYCGSSAIRRAALEEAPRSNVGRRRRRPIADFADEVAELYHERQVRMFTLVDDNLLGDGDDAIAYVRELREALRLRGVERACFSLMIDSQSVTPELVDELVLLGVIRVLVGVEALTQPGLESLGRKGTVTQAHQALTLLRDRGIKVLFNSILIHPEATRESIAAELEAVRHLRGFHHEAIPLLVYPGTAAQRALCETGRATGGLVGYEYQPHDPIAQRFRTILTRLNLAPGGFYQTNRTIHGLITQAALGERLGLSSSTPALRDELEQLLDAANEQAQLILDQALALAETELQPSEFLRATIQLKLAALKAFAPLATQAQALQARLEPQGIEHNRSSVYSVHRRHSAIVAMTLATAIACGGELADSDPSGNPGSVTQQSQGGTPSRGDTASSVGTASRVGTTSTRVIPPGHGGATSRGGSNASGGPPGHGGTTSITSDTDVAPRKATTGADAWNCNGMSINFPQGFPSNCDYTRYCSEVMTFEAYDVPTDNCADVIYFLDEAGKVIDVAPLFKSEGQVTPPMTSTERARILSVLSQVTFPCMKNGDIAATCEILLI